MKELPKKIYKKTLKINAFWVIIKLQKMTPEVCENPDILNLQL